MAEVWWIGLGRSRDVGKGECVRKKYFGMGQVHGGQLQGSCIRMPDTIEGVREQRGGGEGGSVL